MADKYDRLPMTQAAIRRSVRMGGSRGGLAGLCDVTSAYDWVKAGHFQTTEQARGALMLAYQQAMDGMGETVEQWTGLSKEQLDAFRRNDTLPGDEVEVTAPPGARVYFMRAGDHIKIGTSNNVKARKESGQTMNALELQLIGSIPGGVELEVKLHARFDAIRVRPNGEWFHVTEELVSFIDGALFVQSLIEESK